MPLLLPQFIPCRERLSRREALQRIGAFTALLSAQIAGAEVARPLVEFRVLKPRVLGPRAKHLILLVMNGGLSQIDSFDCKPALARYHGTPMPGLTPARKRTASLLMGPLMQSPFAFHRYGPSGVRISELFPQIGSCAGEICFVHSVYTDSARHEPALRLLTTGSTAAGSTPLGASIARALGPFRANLPGFIRLCPQPSAIASTIASGEPSLRLYGEGSMARACLAAAQLLERGVRVVELHHSAYHPWDAHREIRSHRRAAREIDQPFAALVRDLKSRGLLDETVILCASEFGRTPTTELSGSGRDHNPLGFTVWLAGGGIRGGAAYGATDELGLRAVENPVHIRDIHATILHLLGIDPARIAGSSAQESTSPPGRVIHEILA
jgi:hypothetical protein